jgi:TPR repeat protein
MQSTKETCPFCRTPVPETQVEIDRNCMKRIKAGDPVAMRQMGAKSENEGDSSAAFEYWTMAAKLGDAESHNQLATMYRKGNGVEKDEKMKIYHLEKAAIAGHHLARYNLAMHEGENGRYERAVKHLIISANLGHDGSIQKLKESYTDGDVSKEDFAAALRAYQAAMVAMKSPQREAAEAAEAAGR